MCNLTSWATQLPTASKRSSKQQEAKDRISIQNGRKETFSVRQHSWANLDSVKNLFDVQQKNPDIEGNNRMVDPIEVKLLKKNYGNLKAVDRISFSVKQGEIFGLLGPNGAGKTTTIEILEGLREKDGGDVKVLGLDPWKQGYELHKKIGVIPQDFNFFERTTPREAIAYYASLFNVKVNPDEILKQVLLEESGKMLFQNLSGGKSKKLGSHFLS